MTTKVETSSRLQLYYEWKMKGIDHEEPHLFSKKFMNKKTELFRVGIKMPGNNLSANRPPIVFLLTANLQKMGLKVLSVSYLQWGWDIPSNRHKEIGMDQKDLTGGEILKKDENDWSAGIQLFTAPLKLFENDETDFTNKFTIRFVVYLTGIVNSYGFHQMDGLLSQQLPTSINNQKNWTSFKFITTDGLIFRVHKWMLVARSPVFAVLLSSDEEIESIHLTVNCTVHEMNQFINFINTGELEGLVSHALMQLAAKYQIKTLEDICQTAFQDAYALSADKMATIAWHLDSGSHPICNEKNE